MTLANEQNKIYWIESKFIVSKSNLIVKTEWEYWKGYGIGKRGEEKSEEAIKQLTSDEYIYKDCWDFRLCTSYIQRELLKVS